MRNSTRDCATVAVIGGGPAGASAALTLARHGIPSLLLEQSDGSGNPDGECLAPTANQLLHRLGLYDTLLTTQPLPSHGTRSSWGAPTARDFLREPHGHGWHLDRLAFNAALLVEAERSGAIVRRGARAVKVEPVKNGWHIVAESSSGPSVVAADFLVDASGRSAIAARQQGLRHRRFDTLVAAIAVLESNQGGTTDATTLIEATPTGWWYAALLPDARLVVTYFSDPDLLARSALWRPAPWWNHLRATQLIWDVVAQHGYKMPDHIRIRPAASTLIPRPCGRRWIATGDAAAAYDPLSSHGIASALDSGHRAALAITATLAGDATAFSAYTDHLLAGYAHYLWLRQPYYDDEHRWPDQPFWARRQLGGDIAERIVVERTAALDSPSPGSDGPGALWAAGRVPACGWR